MKSCCEDKSLGIQEELIQMLFRQGKLAEGDLIPCLECRMMYRIEKFNLIPLYRLNDDTYKIYLERFRHVANKVYQEKKEKLELNSLYKEFEPKKEPDLFTLREMAAIRCLSCGSSILGGMEFNDKERALDFFNHLRVEMFSANTKEEIIQTFKGYCFNCYKKARTKVQNSSLN